MAMIRLRTNLRTESGFTLVEQLIVALVGIFILGATLSTMDTAFRTQGNVIRRTDAAQRGRLAMDQITQQIRSQVCLNDTTAPIISGTETSLNFYDDLSDGSRAIVRRTLTFDESAKTLTEEVRDSTGTSLISSRRLLENVERTDTPFFRYYAYTATPPIRATQPLTAPLTTSDLAKVSLIMIAFRVKPSQSGGTGNLASTLEDEVFVRLSEPNKPAGVPRCS